MLEGNNLSGTSALNQELLITKPGLNVTTSSLNLATGRRSGLLFDVYDSSNRRLESSVAIADMRNYPAGTYRLRAFDPFATPGHPLFDAGYVRSSSLAYNL